MSCATKWAHVSGVAAFAAGLAAAGAAAVALLLYAVIPLQ